MKYKDKIGRYLTQALFWETRTEGYTPVFTLKDQDHTVNGVTYKSLRKVYMEIADPTEYEFAQVVFGSWEHWQTICSSSMLLPYIEKWREELSVKLRSKAIKAMTQTALEEGSKGTTAAKWLAQEGWKGSSRGRPSKEEVAAERRKEAGIRSEVEDDLKRLKLIK